MQGALSYAISPAHNIELWCSLAKGLVNMGCHEVVIKDTSGLLSPQATWELVTALKETVDVPIDVHSHCSSGMAPMAYMAAVEAGAEILDVAMSPLAWGTSQPAVESVVAALQGGEYDTGLDLEKMWDVQHDVEVLKRKHIENLSPVADRVDASILRYQMPGLMLEDVHRQLAAHNAGGRTAEVLEEANRVRLELGYPPLVAPIRQMIATQAVYNVIGGDRYATVTQELKDYLQGLYGRPPVPADPELRRLVLGPRGADHDPARRPARATGRGGAPAAEEDGLRARPTNRCSSTCSFRTSRPTTCAGPEPARRGGSAHARVHRPGRPSLPPRRPPARHRRAAGRRERRVRRRGRGRGVQGPRQRRRDDSGSRPSVGARPHAAQRQPPPRTGEGTVIAPMQGLIVKLPVKSGRRRQARRCRRRARGDEDAERHRHHRRRHRCARSTSKRARW